MPTKTVLPPTGQEVSERDLAALYSSYASAVLAQNGYIKPLGGIMPLEKRKYTVLKPLPGKIAFQSQEEEYYTITLNDLIQEVAPNYFSTGEQQEGASAFLEKRKPDFSKFR